MDRNWEEKYVGVEKDSEPGWGNIPGIVEGAHYKKPILLFSWLPEEKRWIPQIAFWQGCAVRVLINWRLFPVNRG